MHEIYYQSFLENNKYPRSLKSLENIQGSSLYLKKGSNQLINFSSSDYLGLSQHPFLIEKSQHYAKVYGVGASASRLVTGNLSCFNEIETQLAVQLGQPAALILASGYQTNMSVLEALFDKQVLKQTPSLFVDKLCHSSILNNLRFQGNLYRFQHNDCNHLESLLKKHQLYLEPKFIIAESLYSMEGDCANLSELIFLAEKYGAMLYIDDAHAAGIYGENGWGLAASFKDQIPLVMGTFSKALGSFGGYIACSELIKNYLVNKCKGLIYSTALSPAVLGAITGAIELMPSLDEHRQRLITYGHRVRQFFKKHHLNYGDSTTHIIPWIIGDAKKTREVDLMLEERGILGVAIQPPSVPIGKSRIRFGLSAGHTQKDIDTLLEAVAEVSQKMN